MNWLLQMAKCMHLIVERAGRLCSWIVLILIAVIVYDVVTRKIPFVQHFIQESFLYEFISPTKLQELEWHLHAVFFLLAFGFAYVHNAHVRVDVIRESLSVRTQAWVELAGILFLGGPYIAVLLFFGWDFVASSYAQGEGSDALTGIPNRWIVKSFVIIGLVLLCLAMIATAIQLAMYLFAKSSLSQTAHTQLVVLGSNKDPAMPKDGRKE